jgi:hypothetical protein
MRRAVVAAVTALVGLAATPAAAAPLLWRLEQPAPPPGAVFKVPLGAPGDLQFLAPNRGLLSVEGNALIPRGLLFYDGATWRQLSTVCGGPADTSRIAWAGPSEFWTVSEPSRPRLGSGLTLCHFKGGEVVASYGTAPESPDPYRPMTAAVCNGPSDCWFGGIGSQDATGQRVGAFHLHWDGTSLQTVYSPQGRGVSDLEAFGGRLFESTLVGPQPGVVEPPRLAVPEDGPRLLRRIVGGAFAIDPFLPRALDGVPEDGTELLALDGDGEDLWAVGGSAASGPSAPPDGAVARPPIAVRSTGGAFAEVPLQVPDGTFGATDRFVDVAAVPGSPTAWVAVQPYADRNRTNVRARVALVDPRTGAADVQRLPASGSGRGAATRIACPAPRECWLATRGGWLFHYGDATPRAPLRDPAFERLITFRPNEAAAQFVPDAPPVDDSLLFAPPPVEVEQPAPAPTERTQRVRPLLRNVKPSVRGTVLSVSFRLTRRARVALLAERRKRVVARTRLRWLKPGKHVLRLRLDRRRWPTRLRFQVRQRGQEQAPGGDDPTVVTSQDVR